ncbi:MAG: UDP-glucose/GDP-mannose dehydrogenase family protein [Anaerolineales bacterium]|nr:UDP-glucose/GDP-mannose dehydrogenase family protein [Anaerolineales bacterium]
MNIALFGLGYIGTVTAVALAQEGHTVVGVDKMPFKVECLAQGISPIVEPGVQEMLSEAKATGRIKATMSVREALSDADLSIVCVGTPTEKRTGNAQLSAVEGVIQEIIENLPSGGPSHLVVIRSTLIASYLDEWTVNHQSRIELAFHPEFLREGAALHDFFNPPLIVVGSTSKDAADKVFRLYEGIDAPRFWVSPSTAGLLKYACNAFHALKICFANELARLSGEFNVDPYQLMDIFTHDSQLNISKTYLRPGMSFGGSCLPKDVRALESMSQEYRLNLPVLNSINASNRQHTQFILDQILDLGVRKVLLMGLTFKVGTDDLRESPAVELAERLIGKGCDLRIWEPDLTSDKFLGKNREYALAHLPHLNDILIDTPQDYLDQIEAVVITKCHPGFQKFVNQLPSNVRVLNPARCKGIG